MSPDGYANSFQNRPLITDQQQELVRNIRSNLPGWQGEASLRQGEASLRQGRAGSQQNGISPQPGNPAALYRGNGYAGMQQGDNGLRPPGSGMQNGMNGLPGSSWGSGAPVADPRNPQYTVPDPRLYGSATRPGRSSSENRPRPQRVQQAGQSRRSRQSDRTAQPSMQQGTSVTPATTSTSPE